MVEKGAEMIYELSWNYGEIEFMIECNDEQYQQLIAQQLGWA